MRIRIGKLSKTRLMCLLLAVALMAAACGGEEDTAADAGETAAEPTAPAAEPTAPDASEETGSDTESIPERLSIEEMEAELGPVPEPSEDYRVAAVLKTLINEHWQQMRDGYEEAAAEHGVEVVVQAAQDESDLTGQLAIAETLFGQGFDVMAVSPLSGSNLDPVLQQASAEDVPLLNVDDARVDARVFIGADHQDMGVLAAETIAELLPDGGKVAQIEGQAGSAAAQQRIDGFNSVMEGDDSFDYVASVPGDWDRQTALDAATNIIQEHPDIRAFYANNDTMALGVVEAVRNAGLLGEVIVIGTDGVPDAIRAVGDGELTGTVAVNPHEMGVTALEVAIRLLEGQVVPEWVVTNQTMVTEENVSEFSGG